MEWEVEEEIRFSHNVGVVPYVNNVFAVHGTRPRAGFFFSGAVSLNKKTEEERRAQSLRQVISGTFFFK